MGAPFPPPNTGRPSGGVVFTYENKLWKYTDFPSAAAFYFGLEPVSQPGLGAHLFDLTSDPYETNNLAGSSDTTAVGARALGLSLLDDTVSGGLPNSIDTAPIPRIVIGDTPNQFGCWTPDDTSPASTQDCQMGGDVVPFNAGPPLGNTIPPLFARVQLALSQMP
mmetsp:Transcript_7815/g.11645  ORF Transcript_7815/g.11645 Transcript_7815/m.11645 type:complete len:165 (-) Transcript_7815:175-669(-)